MFAVATYMETDPQLAVRTLVVGLGVTGLSCARFLVQRGVEVAVTESGRFGLGCPGSRVAYSWHANGP